MAQEEGYLAKGFGPGAKPNNIKGATALHTYVVHYFVFYKIISDIHIGIGVK